MTTTQYYVASSLDGFIADPRHSLDWLMRQPIDQDGFMGYPAFIARVGALAMGRTTYEWVLAHQRATGEAWMYDQPSWVFTHRDDLEVPPGADVRFVHDDVHAVHEQMRAAAGGRNVWIVGGGDLVGQFADAGLLDEVLVSIAPVTLGAGAPLLPRVLDLELREVARNEAFACLVYDVVPTAS